MAFDVGQTIDMTPHLIRGRRWRLPFFKPKHRPRLKTPDTRFYDEEQIAHLIRTKAKRVRQVVDDLNITGKPWMHNGGFERDMEHKFGHRSWQVLDADGNILFELHGFPSDKRRPNDSGKLLDTIRSWAITEDCKKDRDEHYQPYGKHIVGPENGYPIRDTDEAADLARLVMRTHNTKPVGYVVPHKPVNAELRAQIRRLEQQMPHVKGFRLLKKQMRCRILRIGAGMDRNGLRVFSPRRFAKDGDITGGNSNNVADDWGRVFGVHKEARRDLYDFTKLHGFVIPKASLPLTTTILARRAGNAFVSTLEGMSDRPATAVAAISVGFMIFGNNPNAPTAIQSLHSSITAIGNPFNHPVFTQYASGELARQPLTIKAIPAILFTLWQMRKEGPAVAIQQAASNLRQDATV